MNKYQEALNVLIVCDLKDKFTKETDTLKELVDRATPKKPIAFSFSNISGFECPDENCGALLEGMKQHCSDCGQALDWND